LTDESTLELVNRCAKQDTRAFEQLVRQFQSYVFALALRLLADEDEAKDIVQECFVRVWKNMDKYDPKRKFTTWLYRIATNLSVDRLRAIKRNRRVFFTRDEQLQPEDVASTEDIIDIQSNRELAAMIQELTEELPVKQRLVFALRDLQDLSVEEVADIADMSVGSVKTNLHYARRRIRELLARRYHVERWEP